MAIRIMQFMLENVRNRTEEDIMSDKSLVKKQKLFVKAGKMRYEVESLKEASEKYSGAKHAFEEMTSYGEKLPRQFYHVLIVDQDDNVIGHIAPNGNIFSGKPGDWRTAECLYNPNIEPGKQNKKEFEVWFEREFKKPYRTKIRAKRNISKKKSKKITVGISH